MARTARAVILVAMIMMIAGGARAAEMLTPADLGWLHGNLNLAGDSPALLELTVAQKARLHALIAHPYGGVDKKRQVVVQFLTEATDSSLQQAVDESTRAVAAPTEIGANQPR
jgi:hypothetical protein